MTEIFNITWTDLNTQSQKSKTFKRLSAAEIYSRQLSQVPTNSDIKINQESIQKEEKEPTPEWSGLTRAKELINKAGELNISLTEDEQPISQNELIKAITRLIPEIDEISNLEQYSIPELKEFLELITDGLKEKRQFVIDSTKNNEEGFTDQVFKSGDIKFHFKSKFVYLDGWYLTDKYLVIGEGNKANPPRLSYLKAN